MDTDRRLPAELTIYTDGACSPNPGPGGWGAVILADGEVVKELSGFGGNSTNNRMELTAAVEVLKSLERPQQVILYTDSTYLRHGITEWIFGWQKNGWLTADRKPVKNSELWQELLQQIGRHQVVWKWVRGHGSNRWNVRADELAVQARKKGAGTAVPPDSSTAAMGDEDIALYIGITCRQAAGTGGWAVLMAWRQRVKVLGGRVEGMTANQLYLHAATEGLRALKKTLPVHLYTYSGYLHDGLATWLDGWRRRNWQTREGQPVTNRELWQQLASLAQLYQVKVHLADRERELCAMQEAKELAREFEQGHS